MKLYYDLNIPDTSKPIDILRYVKCGYTRLAFNRVINVNEFNFEDDNKKISKEAKANLRTKFEKRLAQPILKNLVDNDVKEAASKFNSEVKIFSRLTLVASDLKQLTFFLREFAAAIKSYDILACDARSSDVLIHAANLMVIELITFDLNNVVVGINRHVLSRCQDRNISIEVNLSAALGSSHGRVNTVKFLNELELFRCPPILTVTSGARNQLLIRNPIGLSSIFSAMGLADKIVVQMNTNADKVVARGLARKNTVFGSAAIIQLSKLPGVVSVNVISNEKAKTTTEPFGSPEKKKRKL